MERITARRGKGICSPGRGCSSRENVQVSSYKICEHLKAQKGRAFSLIDRVDLARENRNWGVLALSLLGKGLLRRAVCWLRLSVGPSSESGGQERSPTKAWWSEPALCSDGAGYKSF